MQFRILGTLEAGTAGALAELGPPKQRAVLAILLLHVGEIVPTDRLIDLLWGDSPPRTALHSVQIYISELRKTLEPLGGDRLIVTRPPGYELDVDADAIDARRFERLIEEGTRRIQAGERDEGATLVRDAMDLWRGPALSDFAYDEFAQPQIRRLHDLRLDGIEALAAGELAVGRAADVIPLLDAAIREDPMRERSRELLMLALYRSGRHAEALRTYERLKVLLDDELGLQPSPPIQRMQERILVHDPTLMAPADIAADPGESRNPYKGLRPFTELDAGDYFGREGLVDRAARSTPAGVAPDRPGWALGVGKVECSRGRTVAEPAGRSDPGIGTLADRAVFPRPASTGAGRGRRVEDRGPAGRARPAPRRACCSGIGTANPPDDAGERAAGPGHRPVRRGLLGHR